MAHNNKNGHDQGVSISFKRFSLKKPTLSACLIPRGIIAMWSMKVCMMKTAQIQKQDGVVPS